MPAAAVRQTLIFLSHNFFTFLSLSQSKQIISEINCIKFTDLKITFPCLDQGIFSQYEMVM